MNREVLNLLFFFFVALITEHVQGQSSPISTKLDFDDIESRTNLSMSAVPGVISTKSNETSGDESILSGGSSSKSGPKIHGVRVTVDTGDNSKFKESKESVEHVEGGKQTKRVGIHTDITFEITADGIDDANETKSAQEDASVPIYKGRAVSTSKPHKPYESKTHRIPNFSNEHRSYGSSDRRGYPSHGVYYPQYSGYYPKRPSLDDVQNGRGLSEEDGWHSYIPTANTWTTERYHVEVYKTNAGKGLKELNWKPCYCLNSGTDSRKRRENYHVRSITRPTSALNSRVNNKIEQPFARK